MSKLEQLYQQLRDDIQQGRLPQGQLLTQVELAERYGVSRIPVRDVLQRLKSEGWLLPHGKRGVMVPEADVDALEDLCMMRAQLEPLLLKMAIPTLTHQLLGEAMDILEQLENPKLSADEHGQLNQQFHIQLYKAAERPLMLSTVEQLYQQSSRYIGFQNLQLNYQQTSQDEHYALLELCRQKDISAACELLHEHIQHGAEQMLSYWRKSKT